MSCISSRRYLTISLRTLTTLSRQCRSYAKAAPKFEASTGTQCSLTDPTYRAHVSSFLEAPTPQATSLTSARSTEASSGSVRSSCLPDTVLEGVTWLKDQKPIVSLPDDQYPPWLWTLLKPQHDNKVSGGRSVATHQPGTPEAQKALRRENRKNIKAVNFMKAQ